MQLDAIRAFVKVAELGSFTRAGGHLRLSKARVSSLVKELEAELGASLLSRTTRAVRLTRSGELLLRRAQRLVAEADELAGLLRAPSKLQGSVRVDAPQEIARSTIIPALPGFFVAHPAVEVLLSTTDRRVDVVREGFDCVLRVGKLQESALIARRLGTLSIVSCANPEYLVRHGKPQSLDELSRHFMVHYSNELGADAPSFEYEVDGSYKTIPMRSLVTVNSSESYLAACLAGLGIVQMPRMGKEHHFASGELVEVLPAYRSEPMPVSLVHGYRRHLPRHVRAFMTWLSDLVTPVLF